MQQDDSKTAEPLIFLHEEMRLSASPLWSWQSEYFHTAGISAWDNAVPFYVTSNAFIAHSYAQVIARYLQDLARATPPAAPRDPVYIVELGAGSGKFGYYCLRYLVELYQRLDLPIRPCYVMTDFTAKNLDFWQSQPLFAQFLAEGFLDMALFDVDAPQPLFLRHKGQRLSAQAPGRAVVCLANYVFDSTRHDLFLVHDRGLYEALVRMQAPPELVQDGKPQKLERLSYCVAARPARARTYYSRAHWNDALGDYCEEPGLSGYFIFPTAMFGALDFLRELGGGQMLLLSSDKGYTRPSEIMNRRPPSLAFHGSFSLAVNYDAVRRYAQKCQGLWFHPPPGEGLRTCAYVFGSHLPAFPETAAAIKTYIQRRGPYDYFQLYRELGKSPPQGLSALISHLRDGLWDPKVVSTHAEQLMAGLEQASGPLKDALREGLYESEQLIYPLPGMKDHYFTLGTLHAALDSPSDAIRLFCKSIECFPGSFAAHFNLGLSYYLMRDIPSAAAAFEQASRYETTGREAKKWLVRLRLHGHGPVALKRLRFSVG